MVGAEGGIAEDAAGKGGGEEEAGWCTVCPSIIKWKRSIRMWNEAENERGIHANSNLGADQQ